MKHQGDLPKAEKNQPSESHVRRRTPRGGSQPYHSHEASGIDTREQEMISDTTRIPLIEDPGIHTSGTGYHIEAHSGITDNHNDFGYSTFADDGMWETLFANAGFRINDGVFLPDDTVDNS